MLVHLLPEQGRLLHSQHTWVRLCLDYGASNTDTLAAAACPHSNYMMHDALKILMCCR
jgi:hypothetical protein